MHIDWAQLAGSTGSAAGIVVIVLLCAGGLLLSALSLSGTWLVLAATALAAWTSGPEFPGVATIALFAVLCLAVEAAEWLAGAWGVQRRGGSKLAGFMALLGGLAGMLLGSLLVPVLGALPGALAGSFALAYIVERRRLQRHEHALHIATGAVLAHIAVVLVKVTATIGMITALFVGMAVA